MNDWMRDSGDWTVEDVKNAYNAESPIGIGDYDTLIHSIGRQILDVSTSGYQGNTVRVVRLYDLPIETRSLGLVRFSWGSCCGCDALQGAESLQEVADLRNQVFRETKRFATVDELLAYLTSELDVEAQHDSRELAVCAELVKLMTKYQYVFFSATQELT